MESILINHWNLYISSLENKNETEMVFNSFNKFKYMEWVYKTYDVMLWK